MTDEVTTDGVNNNATVKSDVHAAPKVREGANHRRCYWPSRTKSGKKRPRRRRNVSKEDEVTRNVKVKDEIKDMKNEYDAAAAAIDDAMNDDRIAPKGASHQASIQWEPIWAASAASLSPTLSQLESILIDQRQQRQREQEYVEPAAASSYRSSSDRRSINVLHSDSAVFESILHYCDIRTFASFSRTSRSMMMIAAKAD